MTRINSRREDTDSEGATDGDAPDIPSGVVTMDQAAWMQDRIRTAIRVADAAKAQQRVRADERIIEDAIDGAVNGAAIEIINHLNLKTDGQNLNLKGAVSGRDSHLASGVDDPTAGGGE